MRAKLVSLAVSLCGTGWWLKSNLAASGRGRRHELSNRFNEFLYICIVAFQPVLKFGQFCNNLLICGQDLAHAHESADHKNAHFNRSLRVQHCGGHDCAVLGESVRQMTSSAMGGT